MGRGDFPALILNAVGPIDGDFDKLCIMAMIKPTIVGVGEALFDILPGQARLGGATLNAAVHAHQLLASRQGRGIVVSRIGQDDLGEDLLQQLRQRGMSTDFIQTDPDHDTGRVYVDVSDPQQPAYEIVEPAAWDVMQFDPELEDLARTCDAIIFGTLAQRNAQSRNTIYRMLELSRHALRLLDVNLRQQFFDHRSIKRSMELATAAKMNQAELATVIQMLGLDAELDHRPQGQDDRAPGIGVDEPTPSGQMDPDTAVAAARAMIDAHELKWVAITRGEQGTMIVTRSEIIQGEPVRYEAADGADAVGAGDACAAGLVVGRVLNLSWQATVDLANDCGAYVASQPGATPTLPEAMLKRV